MKVHLHGESECDPVDYGVFVLIAEALARLSHGNVRTALRWFERRSPHLLAEVADLGDVVNLGGMLWLYEREGRLEDDDSGRSSRAAAAAGLRRLETTAALAPIGLDEIDRYRAVACITHLRLTAKVDHIELAQAMVEVDSAWGARRGPAA